MTRSDDVTTVVSEDDPWVNQLFLKDSKLRTVERYFHRATIQSLQLLPISKQQPILPMILPDAVTWRKYLRLIRAIVQEKDIPFRFVLTESMAEYMDYRNQSEGEASAPQERTMLQRLLEEEKVVALADLSIRTEMDEWYFLEYEKLSIKERSGHALLRAAHLLQTPCWLWVDDPNSALPMDDGESQNDCEIQYKFVTELIDHLAAYVNPSKIERFNELQLACQEEYRNRNTAAQLAEEEANPAIVSEEEIKRKIQRGELLRGRLDVTKENVREAYVSSGGKTFFISKDNMSVAFHQDMVIFEILPESQWGRPVGKRRIIFNAEDEFDDFVTSSIPPVPSARVVAIDQPARRTFVATLTDIPSNDDSGILVTPMDIRIPKIRLRTRSWRNFVNVRLKIQVDDWEYGTNYPKGRCVEILGPIGDLETEVRALLIENEVELDPFSAEAIACLPSVGDQWKVADHEVIGRKDLRGIRRIFSVDPPGCQDIDDTMHAQVLENGDIEVGVHIADVTHFVNHNSKLDLEAQARGTTFYLVDRRFDMLPTLLSSNLCSLHAAMDRLAVSVIWVFSADFKAVKSTWYGRTVIHNVAAMTYDQADNIINGRPPDEPGTPTPPPFTAGSPVDLKLINALKRDLLILTQLSRKLRNDREKIGGALDLSDDSSSNELKFTLQSGKPVKVVSKIDKEIHHTIAEMMILANTAVAEKIQESFPDSALLRIHQPVAEPRIEELKELLEAAGIKLESYDGKGLAKCLKDAQKNANSGPFRSLLLHVATRAMTEAQYISTGARKEGLEFSHFGLGLEKYTHFTSPIRRYADVVVHKQLLASLDPNFDVGRGQGTISTKTVSIAPVKELPKSNVISILAGEGLMEENGMAVNHDERSREDPNDGDTSYIACEEDRSSSTKATPAESASMIPYATSEVSSICENLNHHNRLAKRSSYECQSLFLSLYFKSHTERAQGVVTSLRENGFWVYVPKFDMRGPVYVRDANDDVQVEPSLLGLPPESGFAPTLAFSSSKNCRRFPDGSCTLYDDRLEVFVGGAKKSLTIKLYDVVTVELTCDNWDDRARVPSPRLQLVSQKSSLVDYVVDKSSTEQVQITSESLKQNLSKQSMKSSSFTSLYEILSSLTIRPTLDSPLRCEVEARHRGAGYGNETMRGRIVFGEFVNPDTRSAAQEAAQKAASAESAARRAHLLERKTEMYGPSIEKSITLRQQRLAAEKRNARRSKTK